jgi:hypothetical protein
MRRRPSLFAAPLLAALLLVAPSAHAEQASSAERPRIYKWIDENGIAHYTTDRSRIPAGLRRHAEPLGERGTRDTRTAPPAARDEFDAWALRNRTTDRAVAQDAWDDGTGGASAARTGSDSIAPETVEPAAVAAFQSERGDLDARIAELEAMVAEDEESIKALISDVDAGGALARGDDPEFRSIAARLPKYLVELRTLRERRAQLESR